MRRGLTAIQDSLRTLGVQGNYTPSENLHLTLAFIGEYPDADRVLEAVEAVRFSPIPLRLCGIGAFDTLWWARLQESEPLEALVRQLRRALAGAEIPYDRKRFRAHITLVRKPVFRRSVRLDAVRIPNASMTADRIVLLTSTRGKNGMLYTELGAVRADRTGQEDEAE